VHRGESMCARLNAGWGCHAPRAARPSAPYEFIWRSTWRTRMCRRRGESDADDLVGLAVLAEQEVPVCRVAMGLPVLLARVYLVTLALATKVQVRVEIMGSQKCRIVGKSQPALDYDQSHEVFTRTRRSGWASRSAVRTRAGQPSLRG
jgi:hypothetical protein